MRDWEREATQTREDTKGVHHGVRLRAADLRVASDFVIHPAPARDSPFPTVVL